MRSSMQKNLFEQFQLAANLYFLFIGILQAIPAISATKGVPTIYLPLVVILTVSAVRAALEDAQRHRADEKMNRYSDILFLPPAFISHHDLILYIRHPSLTQQAVLGLAARSARRRHLAARWQRSAQPSCGDRA